MQERHTDRESYFREEAATSGEFYVSYIRRARGILPGEAVLEVGCGEGGNLLPFARLGCRVTGIDRAGDRVRQAAAFFAKEGAEGRFVEGDFLEYAPREGERYALALVHDVIEHIPDKDAFVARLLGLLAPGGVVFWGFPAWQMPFGGHQQICRGRLCSRLPFCHLLPSPLYRALLRASGESPRTVDELLDIKRCRVTVEGFERLCRRHGLEIADRCLWLVNPHYKQKFRLRPRRLWRWAAAVPWARNFFSTSCFYLTRKAEGK